MRKAFWIVILLAVSTVACFPSVVEEAAALYSYADLTVLDSGASTSAHAVRLMLHQGPTCGDSASALAFRYKTTGSDGRFSGPVDFPRAPGQACVTLRINGGATYRDTTVAGFRVELGGDWRVDTIKATIRMTVR